MSVINSVLKELDARPNGFAPLGVDAVVADEKPSGRKPFWVILLLLLVLGLAIAVHWMRLPIPETVQQAAELRSTGQLSSLAVPRVQKTVALDPIEPEPVTPANSINGLHIRETEQFMEMEFQMSYTTSSYLKQRANNRYVFVLSDIRQSIAAPIIQDSPWIKQITIRSLAEDIEIRFDTQPGVLVETDERHENSNYHWLIRLKKSISAASETAAKNVKSSQADIAALPQAPVPAQASESEDQAVSKVSNPADKPVRLDISPVEQPSSDRQQMARALRLLGQGESAAAIPLLQQLLGREFDRDARIHLLSVFKQSNPGAYAQLLRESLSAYPQDSLFQLHQANWLFAAQRYMDLIGQFSSEQDDRGLISLVATSLQRLERHEEAVVKFKRALELEPAQPRTWLSLAISQQHLEREQDALASYQMALRSGPLNQRLRQFAEQNIGRLSQ